MSGYTQAVPPPETTRWPGAGRAAALFVGVPLTAALVLAATPLSEPPPMPPAVSALPSRVTAPAAIPVPAAVSREAIGRDCAEVVRRPVAAARRRGATPAVVRAPRIVTASRLATIVPSRAVIAAHAAGRPLVPLSIVAVARGVDRVETQSP